MEIILHAPGLSEEQSHWAVIEECEEGVIWLKGAIAPLASGDVVVLEQPIEGDARYMATAEIDEVSPDRYALRVVEAWRRRQQREFVRVSTYGIRVRVSRPSPSDPSRLRGRPRLHRDRLGEGGAEHEMVEMLDISAGGCRLVSASGLQLEDHVICHFELPGDSCYVLPCRVVRIEPKRQGYKGRRWVAVEFIGIQEPMRSELLRWVFREQVRRHRGQRR
jgi:hypothetical protein